MSHGASQHQLPAGELDRMPQRTQEQLLRAIRAGDRQAAEEIVEATYELVYKSLMKMTGGQRDLSADLTQEVYRKAWQALPRFDGRSQFSTWLYRIAYTTFLNHIRRPSRIDQLDELHELRLVDGELGQSELIDRHEVAARLRRAVLELPEQLRFTVTARFWGELDIKHIARSENVTGAAIRKRLKKAMTSLRSILGEDAA